MKYIDAEKLIALIDTKLEDLGLSGSVWVGRSVLIELKNEIITSLQQEQPQVTNTSKMEQPEVELEKASRNVYESWKGGTMDDFLRDMVELGKTLNARKEK